VFIYFFQKALSKQTRFVSFIGFSALIMIFYQLSRIICATSIAFFFETIMSFQNFILKSSDCIANNLFISPRTINNSQKANY